MVAVGHYDVNHGQPQPPGYWLYVATGRLVGHLTGLGAIHSLVLVSALASAAATGVTALAGRDLGGRWVGLAAGVLMATSPFVWFSGSVVATYSFDALACSLLIVLAWRARPGSWHGIGAAVAFALLAGFRQSVVQSFFLLALVAVVASTRRLGRLAITMAAAAMAAAAWFVPMALEQPGGAAAWWRATRIESEGAAQATSIFDHAAGGLTNLGTFAAYTIVALAPLVVLTALAAVVLGVRRLFRGRQSSRQPGSTGQGLGVEDDVGDRPWYQTRTAILAAAVVPAVALVALVQFAKGGYLLAYLPAATIGLLLPVAAVIRRASRRRAIVWLAVASIGVGAVAAIGAQRFLSGAGVLPSGWTTSSGVWIGQPRYQAPYPDTRAAIATADAVDAGLRMLRPLLHPHRDVVVLDTLDGGADFYRNAGWALPSARVALVSPGLVQYTEQRGALYYTSGTPAATAVLVGMSGSVLLVASPALPGLAALTASGAARPVSTSRPIGDYHVWQLNPGVDVLGVPVVSRAGLRPLGHGIS